jgi:hypothetical protein
VSTSIEELVRQAQHRQAERALPVERILAGMPARARRRVRQRRYRTAVAAAAGLIVLAGGTVPLVARRGGSTGGTRSGSTVAADAVPLRYRPAWLPPGLGERRRASTLGPGTGPRTATVERTWTRQAAPRSRLTLSIRPVRDNTVPTRPGGEATDIRGRTGYLHDDPASSRSYVEWMVDVSHVATVEQMGLGLSDADLVRVAESVRPDPAVLDPAVRIEWLPDDMTLDSVEIGGDGPDSWMLSRVANDRAKTGRSLVVSLTTHVELDGGTPLTVGGRPARWWNGADQPPSDKPGAVTAPTRNVLIVDRGDGRWLTVVILPVRTACPAPAPAPPCAPQPEGGPQVPDAQSLRDETVRVAESVTVSEPDTAWIGTR